MTRKEARKEIYKYLASIDKEVIGIEQGGLSKLLKLYEKASVDDLTKKIIELEKAVIKHKSKTVKKPIMKSETLEEYKERKSKIDFSNIKPSFTIKQPR